MGQLRLVVEGKGKMWVKLSVLSNSTRMTYSSPNESPDQGEEERSQMIGWSPRAEVGAPSVSRSREDEGQSWIRHRRDQMGWSACQDSGKRKTEISWTRKTRNPTFKPDSKNKINAVNPRIKKKKEEKEKCSPKESRLKINRL